MAVNFNNIMDELTDLLKYGQDDPNLVGGGSDIVNGQKGEVGSSTTTIPAEARGDVSLKYPHKDGDTVTYEKEKAYPSKIRNPDSSSAAIPKSKIGDDNMGLGDKPEKRAAARAKMLMDTIESFLDVGVEKKAAPTLKKSMDSLALQKAASFEAGRAAASKYLNFLNKFAEEVPGSDEALDNSGEHRGDLADTAVGRLVPRSDPHKTSDNKSPETEASQTKYKKAAEQTQGDAKVEATLESKAEMVLKAQLYDDFVKAAEAGDETALILAKSNMYDFLNGELK